MKRVALLLWFMVVLLILSAISAPNVQAQKLDGVWLNTKFKAQLYRVDPNTGAYTKQTGSGNDYMHFNWVPEGYYEIEFWMLDDHGNYIHVEPSLGLSGPTQPCLGKILFQNFP